MIASPRTFRASALSASCLSLFFAACFGGPVLDRQSPIFPLEAPTQPLAVEEAGASEPETSTEPLRLSVFEAALMALESNADLKVQRLNPEIEAALAESEQGLYDPELYAQVEMSRSKSIESAYATQDQFEVEARTSSGEVGLRQPLPTGTTLELGLRNDRFDSSRTPEKRSAGLGLTVTQALLRGFGPAVGLASIERAELETKASLYELRRYAETVAAQTEIAYWDMVLAQREIEIYEKSLAVAIRQRKAIEEEILVGTLPQTESVAARAEAALRQQDLINARSALEAARLRLLRWLGQPLDRPIDPAGDPLIEIQPMENVEERVQLALQSRPELGEADLRLRQNRLDLTVTRNGLLPQLDFFATLEKTGYGDGFNQSFKELNGETYEIAGGLSFYYDLGDRTGSGAHRATEFTYAQTLRSIENLRGLIALEVRLAANEAERSRLQIDAAAATRALQERNLLSQQERFQVGQSAWLEVAQAQRDLLSSQIAEVEAQVGYRTALTRLYLAEGSLLERRGLLMQSDRD